jgi:hypothetical protein
MSVAARVTECSAAELQGELIYDAEDLRKAMSHGA